MALYPRAKFLWMIRDGRDVGHGPVGAMPFFSGSRTGGTARLGAEPRRCRALPAAASGPVPVCRFEALVEEPVAEVKRIDEFLGLAFETSQLVTSEATRVSERRMVEVEGRPAARCGSGLCLAPIVRRR